MPLLPEAKNCDISVKRNFQLISSKLGYTASPTYTNITLTDLTVSSLVGTNASKLLESVTVSTGLDYTRPTLSLSHLGIESLTAPGADRIFFWDDSASASKWLAVGNSIAITTTIIDIIQDIRTTATPLFNALYLNELADAGSDVAGDGQLWVHDDTPNTLWFTNDAGDDVQITTGAAIVVGAHTHDGDTLQLDGINSDGGAFSFTTSGTVTFNQTVALSSKLTAGTWGSPIDVTGTRKYGFELHYSGNDYDVFGIRSRANLITTADSSTRTATGAELQAANSNGISVAVLCGAKCSSTGKSTSSSATISTMRAVDLITEWGAKDTITNLYNTHIKCITRNSVGEGSFGTGYGIYLENIAVGGTGQALDAGIRFQETGLGGVEGYNYGIDFSGATFTSEEIKLANGSVVGSDKVTFQPTTDSTTFFQVMDADGGIPVFRIDTTNEWVGVKTTIPGRELDVNGNIRMSKANAMFSANRGYFDISPNHANFGIIFRKHDDNETQVSPYLNIYVQSAATDYANLVVSAAGSTAGLIIQDGGNIGFCEIAPETSLELTNATPYITLHNSTHEDTDGGRESRLIFKGEQSGGEETTLARIEAGHDGSADNEKGYWDLFINDGNDGNSPTHMMRVNSVGVGVGTKTQVSLFEADGALGLAIETVTGNTTLDATHSTVLVNASGNVTITLPTAASAYNSTDGIGRIYEIKKIDADADAVTIDGNGSETIDGGTTAVLTVQYESITIQSDGSNWHII